MGIAWRVITLAVVIGSLVAAPALSVSTLAGPAAQFREGQVLQGPDGSLFVVEGGQLHRLQPVAATADQIGAIPQGDPVITGVAIIPSEAPAAPGPPSAEAFGVRVTVLEIQRPYQGAFTPRSGFEWMVIRLRIDNLRDSQFQINSYLRGLMLEDANGSTRDWGSGGNTPPPPDELPSGFLLPGRSFSGNAIIGVPAGLAITKVLWLLQDNPLQMVEVPLQ